MHADLMAAGEQEDGPRKQRARKQVVEHGQQAETDPATDGEADAMDHVSERRLFGGGRER